MCLCMSLCVCVCVCVESDCFSVGRAERVWQARGESGSISEWQPASVTQRSSQVSHQPETIKGSKHP